MWVDFVANHRTSGSYSVNTSNYAWITFPLWQAISKGSVESAETEGKLPAVNLDGWLRMNVVKNLLKALSVWWLVQCPSGKPSISGKWWLHFPGKEHTFQESPKPQKHQFQSLYRFNAQILGIPEVRSLRPIVAWMGCVDLQWLNYEDYELWIWLNFYQENGCSDFWFQKYHSPKKSFASRKIWRFGG